MEVSPLLTMEDDIKLTLTQGNTIIMQEETNRNYAIEELSTNGGKTLGVYKVANTSLYRVSFTSGGQVPESLLGMWTDPVMAQKAIKGYLSKADNEVIAAKLKAEQDAEQRKLDEAERAKVEAANRAKNVKETSKKAPTAKSVPKNTKKA